MVERISLETAALEFSEANAPHPRIYELPVEEGRSLLNEVQDSPVVKEDVDIEDVAVDTGDWGNKCQIYSPLNQEKKLPVIFYIHGAGWVLAMHIHMIN